VNPFDFAWLLLKGDVSARSVIGYQHLPTEMNYDAISQFLQNNPNSTLGDMMTPYLTGQFTQPTSEVVTDPRSYQDGSLPFPMTAQEAESFTGQFKTPDGYALPERYMAAGRGGPTDRPLLMNTLRTLQGRMRQMPEAFAFEPVESRIRGGQEDSRPTGKMGRLGARLENYMNTPISVRQATMDPSSMMGASNTQMVGVTA
jgi:hypothetical protein